MPPIELETLLGLVGTLDDSSDPGSASDRFRVRKVHSCADVLSAQRRCPQQTVEDVQRKQKAAKQESEDRHGVGRGGGGSGC